MKVIFIVVEGKIFHNKEMGKKPLISRESPCVRDRSDWKRKRKTVSEITHLYRLEGLAP